MKSSFIRRHARLIDAVAILVTGGCIGFLAGIFIAFAVGLLTLPKP